MRKSKKFYKDKYAKYKQNYNDYYKKNKLKINIKRKKKLRSNWVKYTILRTRQKSKRQGVKFTIDESDLILPKFCPVLKINLKIGKKYCYDSPSIDRIDNKKGYVKGNVRIISFSTNAMKSDMPIKIWNKLERKMHNV